MWGVMAHNGESGIFFTRSPNPHVHPPTKHGEKNKNKVHMHGPEGGGSKLDPQL